MLRELGRLLLVFGLVLAVAGVVLILLGRTSLGPLPGDLVLRGRRVTVFFPIATCILLSLLLTLILNIFLRR